MKSKIGRESLFILTLFGLFAVPAFWQLAQVADRPTPLQSLQAQVVFPHGRRALASVDVEKGSPKNCELRQKTKSLCGQTKGETRCSEPQIISYWHCKRGDLEP